MYATEIRPSDGPLQQNLRPIPLDPLQLFPPVKQTFPTGFHGKTSSRTQAYPSFLFE